MKRRNFVLLSTAGLLSIGFSYLYWNYKTIKIKGSPAYPQGLSSFLDREGIRSVGETYRNRFPEDANETRLLRLLGADDSYGDTDLTDIKKAIIKDFQSGNTLLLNGWVLSVTEARQCALFSFATNK